MKKEIRARQFMYVQDLIHLKVKSQELPNILDSSGAIEWAYINHNHDQDENGEPIREHYHIVLKYEHPQTITSIAKMLHDEPQYVQIWHGRINNAYSYLIHETQDAENADGKYHYSDTAVKASFDYPKRLEQIRAKIKLSPKYENEQIRRYAEQVITREQLTQELGVYGIAKHQQIIDKIDAELLAQKHQEWLKKFKRHKMTTLWLHGKAGVGKTRLAEHMLKGKDYITLSSSRDHFQDYHGQRFVILNDLRPNDFAYSDLLRLLDPYQHDKSAPSRYHDKRLNLEKLIITTPYDSMTFYRNITSINDTAIDSSNQLLRRIKPIKVTDQIVKIIKRKVAQRENKKS